MTKKQQRLAFLGGAFALAATAVALVIAALGNSVSYFYTPSALAALDHAPGGVLRLGGLVEAGSVSYAQDRAQVRFSIVDKIARREIIYDGVLPDLFREGQGVVVQGRLGADGIFVAGEVLAKHDEKYMPREVADALKKQGRWREGEKP
jgi:cytochrome c-type biogenesis protein CcmE